LTKEDFIKEYAKNAGTSQKEARKNLDTFIETVTACLVKGESVNLAGFGKFEVIERKGHEGRNPQTMETFYIGATKSPKFKPFDSLKKAVKGQEEDA
jgi:DNA-binding protein HU-beta